MNEQNLMDVAPSLGATTTMALWMSSGGTLEALAESSAAMAGAARSDRHGTAPDDDLRAGTFTTNPFNCADDGLHCSNVTRGYGCIPPSVGDGL